MKFDTCQCEVPYVGAHLVGTPMRCEGCGKLIYAPTPNGHLCAICGRP